MKYLMVTEVARILGRSSEAVRYYERTGKLKGIKTANGRRLFRPADVEALARKLAKRARAAGVPPAAA